MFVLLICHCCVIVGDGSGDAYVRIIVSCLFFHVPAVYIFTANSKIDPFSKAIASAPVAKPVPEDGKPPLVFTQDILQEQAIIYRLSGDYNPRHIG